MAESSLSPRVMREVVETDWNEPESVTRLEGHARRLIAMLAGVGGKNDADALHRASMWTAGVLINAYPRDQRAVIRQLVTELVARVAKQAHTQDEQKQPTEACAR